MFALFVKAPNPGAVVRAKGQRCAPIFVHKGPDDQRGVVVVPPYHFFQGLLNPPLDALIQVRLLRAQCPLDLECAPGGDLRPYQKATLVGQVEVARVGGFNVTAEAVQPQAFGFAKLVAEEIVRRHGVDGVRIEVLVKRGEEKNRLPV